MSDDAPLDFLKRDFTRPVILAGPRNFRGGVRFTRLLRPDGSEFEIRSWVGRGRYHPPRVEIRETAPPSAVRRAVWLARAERRELEELGMTVGKGESTRVLECARCGNPVVRKPGPGRPPRFCGRECQVAALRERRKPNPGRLARAEAVLRQIADCKVDSARYLSDTARAYFDEER